ncbi:LamG domain-containing protein [Streptomyces sp. NPDC059717]|uniref:LamG domain-containing protein n=1 Tax=Streptomyces sp. NPDC059717 TaxID=3346922 RepID=UPI0036CB04EC
MCRAAGARIRQGRRFVSGLTATALLAASVVVGASAATARADATATPATSASEQAKTTGEPVEVTAARTEYSTTTANPDGTFTLDQSTVPLRAKAPDGSWRGIDTTLKRRTDGSIGPESTVVDLSFSGGGSRDLIQVGKEGRTVDLKWPTTLPSPTLDGATATYAEVFPGVDLQLTATAEGYRQVLVVKTAQAAANPELESIELTATGNRLDVVPGAGGGLQAIDDNGNPVLRGPAGQMWDSAGDAAQTPAAKRSLAAATASESAPVTEPRDGDASVVIPVSVAEGSLLVKPDLDVLRGEDTVYPVYIDPPVGLAVSERTVLSSDGDSFWQFNGDLGVGRCSVEGPYYCGSNYVNRMYFEFGPGSLSGKYVLDATFRAYETWSFSCTPHTVDLERTNNISEGTKWPGPSILDHIGDQTVSAGRGTDCNPEQPDAWVEFHDNPAETDENLTSTVRQLADGSISRLTLMLQAFDENNPDAWKRFDDNASLQVTYVSKPGVPTDAGVIPGNGTTQYCNTSSSSPLTVTRTDPMVQARVQTQVQPKSGEDKGSLQAEFRVARLNADKTWEEVWTGQQPSSGWDPDGTLEKMRNTRTDGITYRYRARTQSHWSYNGKTGDLYSTFSPWCYFKIDSTGPKAPLVTADSSPYVACDDVLGICDPEGGPGQSGVFTFKPNPADHDITKYQWRLLTTAASKTVDGSTPTPCVTPPTGTQDPSVALKVCVTPQLAGTQVLSVVAIDVRNRTGPPTELTFKVAPAAGAVGRWHFDDGVPNSTVVTAVDSATEGTTRSNATLYTTGAGWGGLGRRGDADYSLWLNDTTDPDRQAGYAATTAPVVNTRDSFTVSAWAYLTDSTTNQAVLSENGSKATAFALYYSAGAKKWIFSRSDQDVDNKTYVVSQADTANPPLRVWTHLTGVFDNKGDTNDANDTIQLFINGRPQGNPVVLRASAPDYSAWTATSGLQFGRFYGGGPYTYYFKGRVDEAAVWQQALGEEQIRQEDQLLGADGMPAAEMVADWDATTATGNSVHELSQYPVGALNLAAGASINDVDNYLSLNGTSGYAFTTGPVVDETGSFTVTARVRLDSQGLASKPNGYRAQIVSQQLAGKESSWSLSAEKVADGIFLWRFDRTAVNGSGTVTTTASVPAEEPALLGDWVQVTGVFDAQEQTSDGSGHGMLHLYVTDKNQAAGSQPDFPQAAQGTAEFAAGRATSSGAPGGYLPGDLAEVRMWVGALTVDQISNQVLASTD